METSLWNNSAEAESGIWHGEATSDITSRLNWWALLCVPLVIITAAGNILVCLAIGSERHLQNMTNYFLMSLAITDLMVAVLVMPLGIVVLVLGYFPLPAIYCLAWSLLDILFCTASIMHLCTLSIDRFLSLSYPMRFGRNKSRRRVLVKLLPVWLLSLGQCVPLCVLYFGGEAPVLENGVCAVQQPLFQLIGSIVCFYIPLCIMLLMYFLTVRLLNNKQKNHLRHGECSENLLNKSSTKGSAGKDKRTSILSICSQWKYKKDKYLTSKPSNSLKTQESERPRDFSETTSIQPRNIPETSRASMYEVPSNSCLTDNELKNYTQLRSDAKIINSNKNDFIVAAETGKTTKVGRNRDLKRSQSYLQAISVDAYKCLVVQRSITSVSLSLNRAESLIESKNDLEYRHLTCSSSSRSSSAVTVCLAKTSSENMAKAPSVSCTIKALDDKSPPLRPNGSAINTNTAVFSKTENGNESSGSELNSIEQTHITNNDAFILQNMRHQRRSIDCEADSSVSCIESDQNAIETVIENSSQFHTLKGSRVTPLPKQDVTAIQSCPITKITESVVEAVNVNQPSGTSAIYRSQSLVQPGTENVDSARPWSNGSGSRLKRVSVVWRGRGARLQMNVRGRRSHTGSNSRTKSSLRAEQKATKVLGVIFFTFVLLWSPFFTINVLVSLCEDCRHYITGNVVNFVTWLGYVSSLVNPFFYTFFNRTFREAFKKILFCQRT